MKNIDISKLGSDFSRFALDDSYSYGLQAAKVMYMSATTEERRKARESLKVKYGVKK